MATTRSVLAQGPCLQGMPAKSLCAKRASVVPPSVPRFAQTAGNFARRENKMARVQAVGEGW